MLKKTIEVVLNAVITWNKLSGPRGSQDIRQGDKWQALSTLPSYLNHQPVFPQLLHAYLTE